MDDETSNLRRRWLNLCSALSLDGAHQWRIIEAAYKSPERAYHNLNHVRDCLSQLDQHAEIANEPLSLEFALWFHDLIHDTTARDNEEKSAEAASAFLENSDISSKVSELILATRHEQVPDDHDAKLICDIDLSILGKDKATYQDYAQKIRKEYEWVDADDYRKGRRSVLSSFMQRNQIYSLPPFRDRYEQQARLNIRDEIDQPRS